MKTQYTFLNYMAKMSFWGLLSAVGITFLTITTFHTLNGQTGYGLLVVVLIYLTASLIISVLITPIIATVVILFTVMFFSNPNPNVPKFQIISVMIVVAMAFILGYLGWKRLMFMNGYSPDVNSLLLHATISSLALTFVHYRAFPHMFEAVEKRKD